MNVVKPVRFFFLILALWMSGWTILQSAKRLADFASIRSVWTANERGFLNNPRLPGSRVYKALEELYTPGDITLVFRQADFTLYGTGRWLDNFDNALTELYGLSSVQEAHAWLRARNVRFVVLPNYTFPTLYRTVLGDLLADPHYVDPLITHQGFRLFRLEDDAREISCSNLDLSGLEVQTFRDKPPATSALWSLVNSTLGSPDARDAYSFPSQALSVTNQHDPNRSIELRWGRQQDLALTLGSGPSNLPPQEQQLTLLHGKNDVRVTVEVSGHGFLAAELLQYLPNGEITRTPFWDGVVDRNIDHLSFLGTLEPNAQAFRLLIDTPGRTSGHITIRNLRICRHSVPAYTSEERLPQTPVAHVPVAKWQGSEALIGCSQLPADHKSSFVCPDSTQITTITQRIDKRVIHHGDLGTIVAPGFRYSLRTKVRQHLEQVRLWLQRYPESRVAEGLRVIYDAIDWSDRNARLVPYTITVKGKGTAAVYNVFVQWQNSDGGYDERLVGSLYLDSVERSLDLHTELPEGARNLQFLLSGSAEELELQEIQIAPSSS